MCWANGLRPVGLRQPSVRRLRSRWSLRGVPELERQAFLRRVPQAPATHEVHRVDSVPSFPYCRVKLMRITLLPQHTEIELDGRRRVADILRHLGILPGTVMVIRGDELITDQEFVGPSDTIEIRNVISGG